MTTERLLGVGSAALLPCDDELPLPAHHPLANPGFQLGIVVTDGVVTSADPRPGLMHRSAEKLFESRDLRQAMILADRHDWLSSASSEVNVALACEAALGITPPERATWIRTMLVELTRISATLAFLAPVAGPVGDRAGRGRETLVDLQELLTGARVHPGFARIGGVAAPIDDDGLAATTAVCSDLDSMLPALADAVSAYASPLAGVAHLTRDAAVAFGTLGPVGRASGLDVDLRRDEPYLAYAQLAGLVDVCTATGGDVPARYDVLVRQLPGSVALVRACVDELRRLGEGPFDVRLPKVVRLPEGMTYSWIEGPIGVTGCLLVGSGEKNPWRMKIRSASFTTMQAMAAALPGTPEHLLADAVMSFPMVLGDVDR